MPTLTADNAPSSPGFSREPSSTAVTVFTAPVQYESKKIPPEDLWQYFQNGWEFFNQILHAYCAFISTLDYEFLFKYLQV